MSVEKESNPQLNVNVKNTDESKNKMKKKYPLSVKDILLKTDDELKEMSYQERVDYRENMLTKFCKSWKGWNKYYEKNNRKKRKHKMSCLNKQNKKQTRIQTRQQTRKQTNKRRKNKKQTQ